MQKAEDQVYIMFIKSLVLLLVFSFFFIMLETPLAVEPKQSWWQIQSVDVMKYSRDIAREKLKDRSFDAVINRQVKNIADTGATHIAVGTPYDEEFKPFLKRWVDAARKNGLNVWFRGNFSGWEKWFEYEGISREEHTKMVKEFILSNPEIFEDGDLFTSCPECENGGPGDPRITRDKEGHQKFLIDEYNTSKDAFKQIGKKVMANTYSMNGDVARLIMDPETTKALDGMVVIDHYVQSPDKLVQDIENYAIQSSGGKIILGEFGAPIPDIHGNMTEEEQAAYLNEAFQKLAQSENVAGVNYWVSVGGSTQLWNEDGTKRKAVDTLTDYFTPKIIEGTITNEIGQPIKGAIVMSSYKKVVTDQNGKFNIAVVGKESNFTIKADGYKDRRVAIKVQENKTYAIEAENPGMFYNVLKTIYNLVNGEKLGQN